MYTHIQHRNVCIFSRIYISSMPLFSRAFISFPQYAPLRVCTFHIYLYTCIKSHVKICMRTYACMCVHTQQHSRPFLYQKDIHTCGHTHTYIHTRVHECICVCVCIYLYTICAKNIHTCGHTRTYIRTHTRVRESMCVYIYI